MGIYKSKTIYSCNNSISETYIYVPEYIRIGMYGTYAWGKTKAPVIMDNWLFLYIYDFYR